MHGLCIFIPKPEAGENSLRHMKKDTGACRAKAGIYRKGVEDRKERTEWETP